MRSWSAFSEASNDRLRQAQVQTRDGLGNLRTAAEFAASSAQDMDAATEKMQVKTTEVSKSVDILEACFGRIDAVLEGLRRAQGQLETDCPGIQEKFDPVEVERMFSGSYSTAMERDVLQAALNGADLPAAQETFGGNSIELF